MNRVLFMFTITLIVLTGMLICTSLDTREVVHAEKTSGKASDYSDPASCEECHAKYCASWSKSFHGLSIQPYSHDFAINKLTPLIKDIKIGNNRYTADIRGSEGYVVEKGDWPWDTTKYKIENILGGKNVFYFLTLIERGRLQILPLGYDVRTKEWFDITANGIIHARVKHANWKEPDYTFSTACYSCHVSRLSSNYDPKADRYTALSSPGINCDTCHGLTSEHAKIFREAAGNKVKPTELKILSFKGLTSERINSACAPCHAKMTPLTPSYTPGESFFDHYDLTTLEDPDFYPDGRDLGENYTYTRWLMSPCIKSGRLSCLKCHTGSGSFRFTDTAKANDACLPCHAKQVQNTTEHTHHKPGSPGSMCISCHMAKTGIDRMQRSDHSMLPPMPAATITFKSRNACTGCHTNKEDLWADKYVRQWHKDDYQAPFLKRANLIDAARRHDWSKLNDMLSYIRSKDRDEVFAASLIRMLSKCPDSHKIPVFIHALGDDPSPLVRSTAAEALSGVKKREAIQALLAATADHVRLVRIKAASVLARYPAHDLAGTDATNLAGATGEYLASMLVQPDQWISHYNMGNYFLDRGENNDALLAYEKAIKIEPNAVPPYVNSSLAYSRLKKMAKAEMSLNKALQIDPDNAAADYYKGLLKIEQGDTIMAEACFRAALNSDPSMAPAAYNLSILLKKERLNEAVAWGQKAYMMQPETEYGYSLASLMKKDGNWDGAQEVLRQVIDSDRTFADAYLLMGEIYENRGKKREAKAIYQQGLAVDGIVEKDRNKITRRLNALN